MFHSSKDSIKFLNPRSSFNSVSFFRFFSIAFFLGLVVYGSHLLLHPVFFSSNIVYKSGAASYQFWFWGILFIETLCFLVGIKRIYFPKFDALYFKTKRNYQKPLLEFVSRVGFSESIASLIFICTSLIKDVIGAQKVVFFVLDPQKKYFEPFTDDYAQIDRLPVNKDLKKIFKEQFDFSMVSSIMIEKELVGYLCCSPTLKIEQDYRQIDYDFISVVCHQFGMKLQTFWLKGAQQEFKSLIRDLKQSKQTLINQLEKTPKSYAQSTHLNNINIGYLKQALFKMIMTSDSDDERPIFLDETLTLTQLAESLSKTLTQDLYLSIPRFSEFDEDVQINVTPHQLSELLNKHIGLSFTSFINGFRVREAKKLLERDPEINLLRLGLDVGFNSQSIFTKFFKLEFKVTPGVFKKQLLNN